MKDEHIYIYINTVNIYICLYITYINLSYIYDVSHIHMKDEWVVSHGGGITEPQAMGHRGRIPDTMHVFGVRFLIRVFSPSFTEETSPEAKLNSGGFVKSMGQAN